MQLCAAVAAADERSLSDLEQQGLIQAFEFTHEMTWKLMRDYAQFRNHGQVQSMRSAVQAACDLGLIDDLEVWAVMRADRNASVHSFDCDVAAKIAGRVKANHTPSLIAFAARMRSEAGARHV